MIYSIINLKRSNLAYIEVSYFYLTYLYLTKRKSKFNLIKEVLKNKIGGLTL